MLFRDFPVGSACPALCAKMRVVGRPEFVLGTDMAIILWLAIALLLVPVLVVLFVFRRIVKAARTLSNHAG